MAPFLRLPQVFSDGISGVARLIVQMQLNESAFMTRSTPRIVTIVAALCAIPAVAQAHADQKSISDSALATPAEIVDCTLENGDAAHCASYTVKYLPDSLEIGPFCPATVQDNGGIWDWDGENAGLYRINGAYLQMLAELGYQFYDEDGVVNVFDIRIEGPEADHECIAGSVDPEVEMTILIPINPVMADEVTSLGTVAKVGVALDGVPIFADAPSVLDTGHMPALDTCGGHVDPGGWYHWHATATDIDTVFAEEEVEAACAFVAQNATAQFAYAFDGFAIYGSQEADGSKPVGLDECGGHIGPVPGSTDEVYHYHASESFPNLPSCLVGVVAENNFTTTAANGIGAANGGGGPQGGQGPDFASIADKLGVDTADLEAAMQAAGGRDADLTAVAEALGIPAEKLMATMPVRP